MSTIQNTQTLEKLLEYLNDTHFGNQEIGHRLTLGFLPAPYDVDLENVRYTFSFRHRLLGQDIDFKRVTYSEAIINMIISMNQNLTDSITDSSMKMYKDMGLITDEGNCTKELIASVVGNGIILQPSKHTGKTTHNYKVTDNLQNVFKEFRPAVVKYFLQNLDAYKAPATV